MVAVWNCLRKFVDTVENKVILLRFDNTIVVQYMNKQDSTDST